MFEQENDIKKMYEAEEADPQPLNDFQQYEIDIAIKNLYKEHEDQMAKDIEQFKSQVMDSEVYDRFTQAFKMYYMLTDMHSVYSSLLKERFHSPVELGSFNAMECSYIAAAQRGLLYDSDLTKFFVERGEFYKKRAAEIGELHYKFECTNMKLVNYMIEEFYEKNMETIVNGQIKAIENEINEN